jgi:hypothetical protein
MPVARVSRPFVDGCGLKTSPDQQSHRWAGGRCAEHFHVAATILRQALTHGTKRQFRRVAILAEVAQQGAAEAVARNAGQHLTCGGIREVAVSRHDALFCRPRAPGVILKHFFVVIGLDEKGVDRPDAFDDHSGGKAQICEEAKGLSLVAEHEADRFGGIVWDGETLDLEGSQLEKGTGLEDFPCHSFGQVRKSFCGESVGEHRGSVTAAPHSDGGSVVRVLVGQESAVKLFGRNPRSG